MACYLNYPGGNKKMCLFSFAWHYLKIKCFENCSNSLPLRLKNFRFNKTTWGYFYTCFPFILKIWIYVQIGLVWKFNWLLWTIANMKKFISEKSVLIACLLAFFPSYFAPPHLFPFLCFCSLSFTFIPNFCLYPWLKYQKPISWKIM